MRALTAVACGTFLCLLGCGGGAPPPRAPSTTTSTSVPEAPEPPEPEPAAAIAPVPPAPQAPLTSPEDARRMLEERGIDPERLSVEVGEQMQRRFRRDQGSPE